MQHILLQHGTFFVENQGPLATWSTQGMENHNILQGHVFSALQDTEVATQEAMH